MHRSIRSIVAALLLLSTTCGAQVFAYQSDKARLDKAAADCDAGKYKEGAEEFTTLAKEGCPFAQCILGVMYQNGRGVPKNVHSAIGWYMKSAKQGYSTAEEHLGEIYQYGEQGIHKDNKQAADWYRRAAHHGNQKAQMALFKMFMTSHTNSEQLEGRSWLAQACRLPGELTEEARKAFMNLSPMKGLAQVQNNFEYEFADMAVGGTLKPEPGQQAPAPRPVNTLIHQPDGLVGALTDHWDKVEGLERSLAAAVGAPGQ